MDICILHYILLEVFVLSLLYVRNQVGDCISIEFFIKIKIIHTILLQILISFKFILFLEVIIKFYNLDIIYVIITMFLNNIYGNSDYMVLHINFHLIFYLFYLILIFIFINFQQILKHIHFLLKYLYPMIINTNLYRFMKDILDKVFNNYLYQHKQNIMFKIEFIINFY